MRYTTANSDSFIVHNLNELFIRKLSIALLLMIIILPATCLSAQVGQIMIDPQNPAWMVYNRDSNSDGKLDPAFICGPGDPEDFLYRGSRNSDGTRNGDQQAIITNMAQQGVNSIYFQAIRSHGGDGDSSHNPYVDSDPTKGLDGDILSQWDGWLNQLDQAGIVIYFFIYDDSARIWSGDSVSAPELALIQALVSRYQHLKHLVWVIAEEYSERYSAARISNIASAIRNADSHNHIIANHQLSSLVFDHSNDPNIDQFALQYNVTDVAGLHNGMVTAWKNAQGRYSVMMAESVDHGNSTRTTCRQKNWASAMGGANIMILRMDGTSAYNSKMRDCKTLIDFFESTNFNTMSPRDDLGNQGTWVLANPGNAYIAYRTATGAFTLSGISAGKYAVTWFDTISGVTLTQSVNLNNGKHTLAKPHSIGNEAAVWVNKTSNTVPSNTGQWSSAPVNSLLLNEE